MAISFNEVQSKKEKALMFVIFFESTIFRADEHVKKALLPIFVTLSGIIISCKEVQSEKASSPILVTSVGMVIFFSEEHLEKALLPIFVRFFGIIIFF